MYDTFVRYTICQQCHHSFHQLASDEAERPACQLCLGFATAVYEDSWNLCSLCSELIDGTPVPLIAVGTAQPHYNEIE